MPLCAEEKIKRRMAVYADALETVALSGQHGEVGDKGYVGPCVECLYDAYAEGKMDEMMLEDVPKMGRPEDVVFVKLEWTDSVAVMYDKIRENPGKNVVLGHRHDDFRGQSNVLRATLTSSPESNDVLECTGAVDLLRAPADLILRHVPEKSLRSKNAVSSLTEMVARLQEVCLVGLTPSSRVIQLWVPRKDLVEDASVRRTSIPCLPETHIRLLASPAFAEEAAERLREDMFLENINGVEFSLRDIYKKWVSRMPLDGEYPLNHVRAHIGASRDFDTLPDPLPKVSIVTITRNRPRMFALATYNFNNLDYPKSLLEWVIVDDSDPGLEARRSLGALSRDNRVRYVRLEPHVGQKCPLNVGLKRNIGCKVATGDVFVNMDDDDYMYPGSIKSRLAAMNCTSTTCAGSTRTLCYDTSSHRTFYCGVNDVYGDPVCFPEPSMMYTRGFWEAKNWDRNSSHGEGRTFLESRNFDDMVDVPSELNTICITHRNNMTRGLRRRDGVFNDPEALFGRDFARLLDAVT